MRFIYLFSVVLLSCNIDNTGFLRASQSISESKTNGVFLYNLKPNKSIISILKHQKDTIIEAWVEYEWKHESDFFRRKVQKDSVQQLVIRFRRLPIYQDEFMNISIIQGNSHLPWMGVAAERVSRFNLNSTFYVAYKPISSKEFTILDSFRLTK
jgi:hypothetical protein